jgi:hypothetical protein
MQVREEYWKASTYGEQDHLNDLTYTCITPIPAAQLLEVVLVALLVTVVQTELRQSLLTVQLPPVPHLGHEGPPQSTPVSLPFLIPSEQVIGAVNSATSQPQASQLI